LARTLSSDEIERAERFRFERDRDHYIAARGALRAILGRYLNLDPASLAFTYGAQGKPSLPGDAELGFNLSHSEALALVAVSAGRPVGVDLEAVRAFEKLVDVPAHIFSPRELAEFKRLGPSEQPRAFFNAWTRKEAIVKATGLGFSTDVAEVEVTFAPGEPARVVRLHGDAAAAAEWSLRELSVAPEFAAAVAVQGPILETRLFEWSGA
jgi:4'-phosphopantetheinyl transferase